VPLFVFIPTYRTITEYIKLCYLDAKRFSSNTIEVKTMPLRKSRRIILYITALPLIQAYMYSIDYD